MCTVGLPLSMSLPFCRCKKAAAVPVTREGQGIGRALLDYATDWAREHGADALTLNVFPGNTRARALYERAGFQTDLLKLVRPLR